MKLIWLTDIHLNFLEPDERINFYRKIILTCCDVIVITGDIAEAPSVAEMLKEMADFINKPIYFILGNHDYYFGKIAAVREEMKLLTNSDGLLYWLPALGVKYLTEEVILLGQDGWADGRFGDYSNSRVTLNDSRLIKDLFDAKILGKFKLLDKMQQLADLDAKKMHNDLESAVNKKPKKIIILTHVPPFKEACLYNGVISDDNWLPYYTSKAMCDVLSLEAKNNPAIEFLVLCGHAHSEAYYQPIANLTVMAGKAEYYSPEIQNLIVI